MKQQLVSLHKECDTWSSSLENIEIASDFSRAIVTIPLMHVGPNKKGLFWTDQMLEEVVPLFQSTNFRYDLDGQEGSSHTTNKLSSPHFDVGWTYPGNEGAWYDSNSKTLWVKGEVTHPQVIEKLQRKTTDGRREVNFASMGIIVEEAKCSICGATYGECEHERMQEYDGKKAFKVPVKCSKGLHVALTNDPADGEANIADCIFQELGDGKMIGQDYRAQEGQQNTNINNQMDGGLAPASPQTAQPGMAPSPEQVLKDLAERLVTVEQKISEKQMAEGTPELVNAAPQDQLVQDNMGVTEQFEKTEANKMDVKDAQNSNVATPVNPAETQDADPMSQVMSMLQAILAKLDGAETQDMGKEAQNANKGMIKHDETNPTEHAAPGDAVNDPGDAGNKKNKENMNKPGSVATADDAPEEPAKEEPAKEEKKEVDKEVADLQAQVKELRSKMEIQDQEVPEFGGVSAGNSEKIDVADMTASERREKYGEYGAFDAIFKGHNSAKRFTGE